MTSPGTHPLRAAYSLSKSGPVQGPRARSMATAAPSDPFNSCVRGSSRENSGRRCIQLHVTYISKAVSTQGCVHRRVLFMLTKGIKGNIRQEPLLYIYIYTHTYTHTHTYTYIYIYKERERDIHLLYARTYICMCIHIYIYIYIYLTLRMHVSVRKRPSAAGRRSPPASCPRAESPGNIVMLYDLL